jgi:hypothetical protein
MPVRDDDLDVVVGDGLDVLDDDIQESPRLVEGNSDGDERLARLDVGHQNRSALVAGTIRQGVMAPPRHVPKSSCPAAILQSLA